MWVLAPGSPGPQLPDLYSGPPSGQAPVQLGVLLSRRVPVHPSELPWVEGEEAVGTWRLVVSPGNGTVLTGCPWDLHNFRFLSLDTPDSQRIQVKDKI